MTRERGNDAPEPLRIAVVGCGVISQAKHLPNLLRLSDRFAVTGICDPDAVALERSGRWTAGARRYSRPEALFEDADRFDAVLVATSGSHVAEVTAAARCGKHVFVEKPLALTACQAGSLVREITEAVVVCTVGYMKRYAPATVVALDGSRREVLSLARADLLHPPEDAYLRPVLGWTREASHSFLDFLRIQVTTGAGAADLVQTLGPGISLCGRVGHFLLSTSVIHDINLLRAALGPRLEVVSSCFWNGGLAGQATMTAPSGATAILTYAFVDGGSYSEKVGFVANHRRFDLSFPSPYLSNVPVRMCEEMPGGDGSPLRQESHISYADPFQLELIAFHDEITGHGPSPTTAVDALGDLELIAEIARVAVDLDRRRVKEELC